VRFRRIAIPTMGAITGNRKRSFTELGVTCRHVRSNPRKPLFVKDGSIMLSMELYATKVMPHFPRVVRIRPTQHLGIRR
jgi:hypothetical protein